MFDRRARRSRPSDDDVDPPSGSSIELDGVVVHRGRRLALRDVSFTLAPGTLTAVVGPNGAGKSSLFGVITGRLRPSEGRFAPSARWPRSCSAPRSMTSCG